MLSSKHNKSDFIFLVPFSYINLELITVYIDKNTRNYYFGISFISSFTGIYLIFHYMFINVRDMYFLVFSSINRLVHKFTKAFFIRII